MNYLKYLMVPAAMAVFSPSVEAQAIASKLNWISGQNNFFQLVDFGPWAYPGTVHVTFIDIHGDVIWVAPVDVTGNGNHWGPWVPTNAAGAELDFMGISHIVGIIHP